MQAGKGAADKKKDDDEPTVDETKFDEFMGNDAGAFAATGEYDQDDREADAVWDQIDEYMDQRRRHAAHACSSMAMQAAHTGKRGTDVQA